MIPENKKTAVSNALQATFGTDEFEDIRKLTDGLSSALIFQITVLGKPYLLRIITRTDAMADPAKWYDCMIAAARVGIAPQVWYTNVEERICITDFVNVKPFPFDVAKVKMPRLLKKLHSLPPFPARLNYLDAMDGCVERFMAAKMTPPEMTDELFKAYEKIKSMYPRNSEDMVSCHNDLKPENTLFDGERVWLVDWEAAFLNDRYLDLAIIANFVVKNDDDEKDYLEEYFGKGVGEYHYARFFLMRQMLHLFYLAMFMLVGKTPDKPVDLTMPEQGFREFHDLIWIGKISLASMDSRIQYALVHMEQLRHNFLLKRFEDSINIVSSYYPLPLQVNSN